MFECKDKNVFNCMEPVNELINILAAGYSFPADAWALGWLLGFLKTCTLYTKQQMI